METQPEQQPKKNNLLDEIASDPDIINRSAAEAGEPEIVPVSTVEPKVEPAAPVQPSVATPVGGQFMEGEGNFAAPELNLLSPSGGETKPVAPVEAVVGAPAKRKRKVWPVAIVVGVLVIGLAGTKYYMLAKNSASPKVAVATPSPTPTSTPSPTPSPLPTPTPTPEPIPAAVNVTAPAAVPTSDRPQAVTVKSRTGLWLRSSANSSNKKNIIGWIPYGGTVSVDAVGDFWWHGTYGGKVGYFASNYTQ